jgi:hypothetical protein
VWWRWERYGIHTKMLRVNLFDMSTFKTEKKMGGYN